MRRFGSAAVVGVALFASAFAAAAPDAVAPPRGAVLAALAQPPVRTAIASERIYFVMTDRYENGNTANDALPGYDPTNTGYFHGGDFSGLASRLERLRDLGFTAVWVTPPFVNKAVQGDSAGYHGYWGLDFTRVDPHLGGDAEFGAFVERAHAIGLKVYLDVVLNHTADVIQLPSYEYGPPKTPIVPEAERNAKSPAWLNDPTNYHNRGNINFSSCDQQCFELGDFFGLDDIATEQSDVRMGLVELFADWIRRYRIDGFRIDTARHVERSFFPYWVPRIQAAARDAGVPSFEIFGEAFITDAVELSTYVRDRGLPNVLDFPMQDAIARFVSGSAGADGIRARLADDDYFTRDLVVHTPPTFLGNHDIGRAAYQVREKAPAATTLLERTLLGYDLLYLLRGAPVVYYGDELGIIGRGGDKAARHDLFPTQVQEWRTEERVGMAPIGSGSSFDVAAHPIAERLRVLARLRETYPALATGPTFVRRVGRSTFAVSRIDVADRREYLVIVNAGATSTGVSVLTFTPGSNFTPILGTARELITTRSAAGFSPRVPAYSTVVLRADNRFIADRPRRPSLRVARDSLTDLVRLSAQPWEPDTAPFVRDPMTFAFAVRRAGSSRWTRISSDDSEPYRAFLDPARFRNRERVHLVAIARGLDGSTAVSRVVPFTVRR